MQIKSNQLVITRHPALVEYLKEIKLVDADVEVIEHASPEMVKDRCVYGVLPHSLSCLTKSFTECRWYCLLSYVVKSLPSKIFANMLKNL